MTKLAHLDEWTRARQHRAQQYELMFTDSGLREQVTLPHVRREGRHVFHQFVIRVNGDVRDSLRDHLRERGIGNDVYYPVPLHLQNCFSDLGYEKGELSVSEQAAAETIALPIYPELTDEQQDYVVRSIAEFFD